MLGLVWLLRCEPLDLTNPLFEEAEADKGAADFEKSFVDIGTPLVPHLEPPETVEPGVSPLDHPAMLPQPLLRLHALAGNPGGDATSAQSSPILLRRVPLVRMQFVRPLARPAARALDRLNGVDRRLQHGGLVDIGRRQDERERDPLAVDHNMALSCPVCRDPSDSSRFFAPRERIRWKRRCWPDSSRCDPLGLVDPGRVGEGGSRLRTLASREDGARRSCRYRSPSPWAASPRGCHFGGRRGYRPGQAGPTPEDASLWASASQEATGTSLLPRGCRRYERSYCAQG
jgi:hypothetical protein